MHRFSSLYERFFSVVAAAVFLNSPQDTIERLSDACLADYVRALADIVDRRMEAELHFDRERGERILEKLRDH